MAVDEQTFHYMNGLNPRIRIEVEKYEPKYIHFSMKIADKMETVFHTDGYVNGY